MGRFAVVGYAARAAALAVVSVLAVVLSALAVVAAMLAALVLLPGGGGTAAAGPAGWVWPLAGVHRVTRSFEPPQTAYGPGHRGVDLAGRAGQLVRAAGSGRVSFAGPVAGRGVVAITHPGGLKTTYEPVRAGVRAGAAIAVGARSASSTAGISAAR